MQTTIYYSDNDSYVIKQVDMKGRRERKSRSAVILSILEEYFECEKRIGEILVDLGAISHTDLAKGLELQKSKFTKKLLGDILLEEELVEQEALERAVKETRWAEKGIPFARAGRKAAGLLKEVASYQQWERILKTGEATVAVFVGGRDKTRCWRGRLSPSGTRISCINFGLNIHSATTAFRLFPVMIRIAREEVHFD